MYFFQMSAEVSIFVFKYVHNCNLDCILESLLQILEILENVSNKHVNCDEASVKCKIDFRAPDIMATSCKNL